MVVRVLGIDAGKVTVINGGVAKYLSCIKKEQPALPGGKGDGGADGDGGGEAKWCGQCL